MKLTGLAFPDGAGQAINAALVRQREAGHQARDRRRRERRRSRSPTGWPSLPPPGHQNVADARLIGDPRGPAPLRSPRRSTASGRTFRLEAPVQYVSTDPVRGERLRETLVVASRHRHADARRGDVRVTADKLRSCLRVRAGRDGVKGAWSPSRPRGMARRAGRDAGRAREGRRRGDGALRGDARLRGAAAAVLRPAVEIDGKAWSFREHVIDYPAHSRADRAAAGARFASSRSTRRCRDGVIGYVEGSGDTVADDLAHLGVTASSSWTTRRCSSCGPLALHARSWSGSARVQHARRRCGASTTA